MPAFNHTRGDGPFDPCPTCLEQMSAPALVALVQDLKRRRLSDEPTEAHIATVTNDGDNTETILGVFLELGEAHDAIRAFNPWEDDGEDATWARGASFTHDPQQPSGATDVSRWYIQEDSDWEAHCITYELR